MIKTVSTFLATLTFLSDIAIVVFFVLLLAQLFFKVSYLKILKKIFTPYSYHLVFLVALTSTLGSLFYSEIAKYSPCVLCWYQRIFMYPQVFLVYLANIRNERVITPYLILMNVIGALLALYHYIIQLAPKASLLPCEIGGAVSCTKKFTLYYGFITIPMMSLTAFVLNLILLIYFSEKSKRKVK
ncbi:MAG: disulfide bond formation protein B [Candidatus Roizmanbacteria bacterium]|nr:MAG: disulfide bond formation protein B [Candidatus Roizmanbacteria bacterium]